MATRRLVRPQLSGGSPPPPSAPCATLTLGCTVGTVCCSNLTVTKTLNPVGTCCPACTPPPSPRPADKLQRKLGDGPTTTSDKLQRKLGDGNSPPPPPPNNNPCDQNGQLCLFTGDSRVVSYTVTVASGEGNQLCFMTTATVTNTNPPTGNKLTSVSITASLYGNITGGTSNPVQLGTFTNQQGLQTTVNPNCSVRFPICNCVDNIPDGLDLTSITVTITVTYNNGNAPGTLTASNPVAITGGTCANQDYYLYDGTGSFSATDPTVHWQAVNFDGQPNVSYTVYQTISSDGNCGQTVTNTVNLVGLPNTTTPPGQNDPPPEPSNVLTSATASVQVNCANVEVVCSPSSSTGASWSLTKVGSLNCSTPNTINYQLTANQLGLEGESIRVSATAQIVPCASDVTGCCAQLSYQKQFTYKITGYPTPCPTGNTEPSNGVVLESGSASFPLGCTNTTYCIVQCVVPPSSPAIQSIEVSISSNPVTVNLDCSQTCDTTTTCGEASCCQNVANSNCCVVLTDQLQSNGQPLPTKSDGKGCCYVVSVTAADSSQAAIVAALFTTQGYTIPPGTSLPLEIDYAVLLSGSCSCITNNAKLSNTCGSSCAGQVITVQTSTELSSSGPPPPPLVEKNVQLRAQDPRRPNFTPARSSAPALVRAGNQSSNTGTTGTPKAGCATCKGGAKK